MAYSASFGQRGRARSAPTDNRAERQCSSLMVPLNRRLAISSDAESTTLLLVVASRFDSNPAVGRRLMSSSIVSADKSSGTGVTVAAGVLVGGGLSDSVG